MTSMPRPAGHRTRILGIEFFHGTAGEAVEMMKDGGLLVVPAAPALKDISTNADYREALLNADVAIADSGFMVLVWSLLTFRWITRLSGLQYLRCLLRQPEIARPGNTMWVMASPASTMSNISWLAAQGMDVPANCIYMAPMYARTIDDPALLEQIETLKPQHIVITIGGGTQERLGLHLKRRVSYRPSIHCVGAAIAFLSGDQVRIPMWADTLMVGWLFRAVSDPKRYVPRYWNARKLFGLMARYRDKLPELIDRRR